jgi:hypothetical protein
MLITLILINKQNNKIISITNIIQKIKIYPLVINSIKILIKINQCLNNNNNMTNINNSLIMINI